MGRRFLATMLILVLMGVWTLELRVQPAKAKTIIVPDDYPIIQDAINSANEGDTVFVRNGVYKQHVILNKTLSLVGENRETTLLDWGVVVAADGTSVSGFTIYCAPPLQYDWIAYKCAVYVENSKCLITNNTISVTDWEGIFLDGRSTPIVGNLVVNNIVLNSGDCGILLWGCNDSLIASNVVKGNRFGMMAVFDSCGNSIENNEISDNIGCAISLGQWASANLVRNNTILRNGGRGAIQIFWSCSNRIVGNNLTNNWAGLWQRYYANDNIIYHNAFVNNGAQVVYAAPEFPCKNIWDNGYPSGGNYWSDYPGNDSVSGPFQNVTGSDGIGDTPYTIGTDNVDRYPLMNPFDPLLGDVNEDQKVDMQDVSTVLDAFGSFPNHPRWNPMADVTVNGKVDTEDIVIILANFGRHR